MGDVICCITTENKHNMELNRLINKYINLSIIPNRYSYLVFILNITLVSGYELLF
jgi:hypothetical protein